jgi:hypothetical protein
MTKDQEAFQLPFLLHGLKSEQGSKGFACTRPRMNQNISSIASSWIQSPA